LYSAKEFSISRYVYFIRWQHFPFLLKDP